MSAIDLLNELAEFLEGQQDVTDGSDGPRPNRAMSLLQAVDDEIRRLKNAAPQAVSHDATKPGQPTPGADAGTSTQPAVAAPNERDGPSRGEWIPVSDAPKFSGWYLVWPTDGMPPRLQMNSIPFCYYFTTGGGYWNWNRPGEVSHWMPLPDAPNLSNATPRSTS